MMTPYPVLAAGLLSVAAISFSPRIEARLGDGGKIEVIRRDDRGREQDRHHHPDHKHSPAARLIAATDVTSTGAQSVIAVSDHLEHVRNAASDHIIKNMMTDVTSFYIAHVWTSAR